MSSRGGVRISTEPRAPPGANHSHESGDTAMWQAAKTPEAPARLENLKELVTATADSIDGGSWSMSDWS